MTLPRPTIVIFDMDGTTVRHLNPFILSLCERYDDVTYRISKFFGWLFCRKARGPIIPKVDLQKQSKKAPRLLVHRAVHKMRRREVDQIVEPCPGIYSVLGMLKSYRVPMALVSNGLGKGYGHDVLKTFDLAHYYDAAIFREDIQKAKPHPEPLLIALREMGAKLSSDDVIWYVGDRHKDITAALEAARHVPAKVVPIAYGMNAAAAVIERGLPHNQIILSYDDMRGALSRLLRRGDESRGLTGKRRKAANNGGDVSETSFRLSATGGRPKR